MRTKFIDPDYRRAPKTSYFCARCQKDIDPQQPHRFIAYELDCGEAAIHAEDWETACAEIKARRAPHLNAFIVAPVGMDCARRIGMRYTRANKERKT